MFHNSFLVGFIWATILWLGAYYPARAVAKQAVVDVKNLWKYLNSEEPKPTAPAPVTPVEPAPAPVA